MPIAAVPKYLGADFKGASPGMRFGMYLPIWTSTEDLKAEIKKRAEAKSAEGQKVSELLRQGIDRAIALLSDEAFCRANRLKPLPKVFGKNDFAARTAWKTIAQLNPSDRALLKGLAGRQLSLARANASHTVVTLEAICIAPFTTGLGNEHPLENGFSFFWPYGLPYLPGSGVKGVLRKAAQELADGFWEDSQGWSQRPGYEINVGTRQKPRWLALSMIDVLFGREPQRGDGDHVRGALTSWDVIPQISGDSLLVEIMTPHQSHYYQPKKEKKTGDSESPHDSGQPNPIAFLTVPPGSTFVFHVVCDEAHLKRLTEHRLPDAPDLLAEGATHWKTLIARAFEHAFQWLGFGAKTAVGYGAMQPRTRGDDTQPASSAGQGRSAAPAADSARVEVWEGAKLTWKPGSQEMTAAKEGKVSAPVKGAAESAKLFSDPTLFERLKKKGEVKGVRVEASIDGNRVTLTRVLG